MSDPGRESLATLAASRWRLATALTAAMVLVYFGFLGLAAFAPAMLGHQLVPGLSVGILLGALVIVTAWLLTWVYVRWTNRHYDPALERLRQDS